MSSSQQTSNSLTTALEALSEIMNAIEKSPLSDAMAKSREGSDDRQPPDLHEDVKEAVKEAIYEVQEEQGDRSSQSGSNTAGRLLLVAGLAALGFVAYRRRQSEQSTTHVDHAGGTRHANASDLPESETVPPHGEPPHTSDSSESSAD